MMRFEQFVAAPADVVWAFFAQPENVPKLHPLVRRVTVTGREGATVRFELEERVPFGPFSLPNRYRAEFTPEPGTPPRIRTKGFSFPAIEITGQFIFEPTDGGTRVIEEFSATAPFGMLGFVTRTAAKAHRAQLQKLAAHFAAPG